MMLALKFKPLSFPPINKQLEFLHKMETLPRPALYDRHIYYVEVSDFAKRTRLKTPTWFSMIRDPVDKFVSRFNYLRKRKFIERMDSNLNRLPEGTDYKAFRDKDLETCIMSGDVECTFFLGRKYDLSIVSDFLC